MRRSIALLLTLALVLVTGCAQLPMAGSPHSFPIEAPNREPLGQIGSGPQAGSTPEQLISDFLRASAAGSFDNYDTAKSYLLPSTAATWQPTAQVTIFPTDHIPVPEMGEEESGNTAQVTLTVPATATVGEDGFLHEFGMYTATTLRFRLARQDGEWRIAGLEDGVILSQSSFTTEFGSYNVYFVSADGQSLVADPRWVSRSRVASHLAQAVLQGPPEILEGAVMNHLAEGLDLTTQSVDVTKGVARVDLRGQLPDDAQLRRLLKWEITETLKQSASVTDVEIAVNDVNLDAPDLPTGPDYSFERIVWLEEGALSIGLLSDSRVLLSAEELGENPSYPAVGPLKDSPVAWIGNAHSVSIAPVGGGEVRTLELAGASKPSIDRWGNVWTTTSGNSGEVALIQPSAEPATIPTGLSEQEIVQVAISPDGARIALLTRSGGVWIGTLVTDGEGKVSISRLSLEERVIDPALSISWAGSTVLLTLTSDAVPETEERQVKVVPIGGFLARSPAPDEVRWVNSGVGASEWITQREDQTAFQRVGASWRPISGSFEYIASPG
ncbi:LpqB family beta-propeller domain-containing protein [Actinomycetaceae bacterium MB13-C1-2]|nr:LpqB family beta-propeller domain-containing protein [Actinomycetaceae bacterium MB13-C1-2]